MRFRIEYSPEFGTASAGHFPTLTALSPTASRTPSSLSSSMSTFEAYKGALALFSEASSVGMEAVGDDQEEELESYTASADTEGQMGADTVESRLAHSLTIEDSKPLEQLSSTSNVPATASHRKAEHARVHESLKEASKNIVTNNTLKEYNRLWDTFVAFCIALGFITTPTELQESGRYRHLPPDLPSWVSIWIMNK
ncbi:hypothetical protein C8T65DRAFT_745567 [Cerioporus squamosus]|nr:hypothetical protein C8T65DRAFT_745567 [Cerioporus squamosus]